MVGKQLALMYARQTDYENGPDPRMWNSINAPGGGPPLNVVERLKTEA